MRIRANNVVSGVCVAAVAAALTACSPSLEEPSDMPPGQEVPMSLSAPASLTRAPEHDAADDACPIEDFTVEGGSDRKPSIVVPDHCETPTKLQQTTLKPGSGPEVSKGDTVSVNYVLVGVTSGKEVTSWTSPTETTPEQITVGAGEVIPGWDKALVGMKAEGRALVVIPPKQGAAATTGTQELDYAQDETLALVIEVQAIS
ncbi:FKBP-type peptidyl-prolyl cis-trans isomerase [Haloechinothrix salitolerans]|uniref:Peptidyl-prolyl cis-trans isomerase n=1 Tax=Haloechinothrix salitolerans TaxID=926830 RepID=A0ABW2C4J1_9PSEU